MIYDGLIKAIEENRANADSGNYNVIPFMGLDRLETIVPGVEKSCMYIVTASSGVGKSKLTRQLFITGPYEYCKENKDISTKIFVFSLEESLYKVIGTELIKWLKLNHKIGLGYRTLFSRGRKNILPDDALALLKSKEAKEFVDDFTDTVEIITDIKSPYKMYEKVEKYMRANGEFVHGQYIPHDPNHYVIVVADHVSLLNTTKTTPTLFETMGKWSSDYCLRLKNTFGCSVVNVQQQASQQESVTNKTANMLEPTASGLGDNKLTQRDAEVIMAIYDPWRHHIREHANYDIAKLREKYRSLAIIKNRDGLSGRIGMLFNGEIGMFQELPRANDEKSMKLVYDTLK